MAHDGLAGLSRAPDDGFGCPEFHDIGDHHSGDDPEVVGAFLSDHLRQCVVCWSPRGQGALDALTPLQLDDLLRGWSLDILPDTLKEAVGKRVSTSPAYAEAWARIKRARAEADAKLEEMLRTLPEREAQWNARHPVLRGFLVAFWKLRALLPGHSW